MDLLTLLLGLSFQPLGQLPRTLLLPSAGDSNDLLEWSVLLALRWTSHTRSCTLISETLPVRRS